MILQVISESWVDIAAPFVVFGLPLFAFIAWLAWSDDDKTDAKGRKRRHRPSDPGSFSRQE